MFTKWHKWLTERYNGPMWSIENTKFTFDWIKWQLGSGNLLFALRKLHIWIKKLYLLITTDWHSLNWIELCLNWKSPRQICKCRKYNLACHICSSLCLICSGCHYIWSEKPIVLNWLHFILNYFHCTFIKNDFVALDRNWSHVAKFRYSASCVLLLWCIFLKTHTHACRSL